MATMYLSLGADKAIALSREIPDAKVYFILDDGKDGLRNLLLAGDARNDDSRIIPIAYE